MISGREQISLVDSARSGHDFAAKTSQVMTRKQSARGIETPRWERQERQKKKKKEADKAYRKNARGRKGDGASG